jgi:PST family polysaccharide transporter
MLRTKVAALLIGTSGLGLMSGFTAIQSLISTVAGLGVQSSAVREIALAVGKGDQQSIGRTMQTLRRISWVTGLVGMLTMIAFSPLFSRLTFNSGAYTMDIAALGIVILLVNLTGSQLALLQGMRRIGDMARANIGGAVFGTLSAIGFYYWLGLRGIVPSLVSIAAIQLTTAWYFARTIPVPSVTLAWGETFREVNDMMKLGIVFMWSGLMVSAVSYFTITLIIQLIDLHAAGLYSAAFLLSGMFVNFVLGAMGADYYPRLTSVAHDKAAMNCLVNEQTEVGLLLALPGLLATLALAPWILQIFYSHEFLGAVALLQWFILGCLGRVISWPLGFVMLALGKGRWFLLTETSANLLHFALVALGLHLYGIEGVAVAFAVMYVGYIPAVLLVSRRLIGFKWSAECTGLGMLSITVIGVIFISSRLLPLWLATWLGLSLTLVAVVLCLRGLVARVGSEHRIARAITRLPGGKLLLTR